MKTSNKPISRLRQRLLEDMAMRKIKPLSQKSYIRSVCRLSEYLGFSRHKANAEDLRSFQLHLVNTGTSAGTVNAIIAALRFFYDVTVGRPEVTDLLAYIPVPRGVPQVLSTDEVARLLDATGSAKFRAALAAAYGAGLRASEVVHLRVNDIDSKRMALFIECGKGGLDRHPFDDSI